MLRHNTGKPQLSLVPSQFLLAVGAVPFFGPMLLVNDVAHVLTFGATKYALNNWRLGGSWLRNLDSAFRHIQWYLGGEIVDPESGLHHLAHLGCNIAFLLTFQDENLGTDDRYVTRRGCGWDAPEGTFDEVIEYLIAWRDGASANHLRIAAQLLAAYYERNAMTELGKVEGPDDGAPAAPAPAADQDQPAPEAPADQGEGVVFNDFVSFWNDFTGRVPKSPSVGKTEPPADEENITLQLHPAYGKSLRNWLFSPDAIRVEAGEFDGDPIILFFDPSLFPHLVPTDAPKAN